MRRLALLCSVALRLGGTAKADLPPTPMPPDQIKVLARDVLEKLIETNTVHANATTRAWFGEMAKLESGQRRQDMEAMTKSRLDPAAVKRLEGQTFYNALLHTTCVATMLDGGHAENALPQRAGAAIQCRMMPEDSQAATQALIEKALADPQIKVTVISPAVPTTESPLNPSVTGKMRKVIESMWPGLPMVPDMDVGASDSIFTRAAGIPTYGITGLFADIDDNRMHGRDERVRVNNYYEEVEFTYRELKAFSAAE